jgi:hypothetical protein
VAKPDPAPIFRSDARWFFPALVVVVVLSLYQVWRANPNPIHPAPYGYYGLLTQAFAHGQTHLLIEPDPRLAELENPWGGAQGIPRVHDASYYNGRYYLYFGAGPVILLLLPWHLLTGTFLADGAASGLFCTVAVVLMSLLWRRFRSTFFPHLSPWLSAAIPFLFGIGGYFAFLLHLTEFYQVPIAAALACGFLGAHFIWRAVVATDPGRVALWFGAASLALGAAVASRPNYLWTLLPLGLIALWRMRELRPPRAKTLAIAAATVLPAAAIGLALAWYNYVRFGNPLEFGVHYQFASNDQRFIKLFDLANVRWTLRAYLLEPLHTRWYFPFVGSAGDTFGVLWWAPWSLLAWLFPLTLLWSRWRDRRWFAVGGFVFLFGTLNFLGLLGVPFAYARYQVDFLPAWLFVAWLVGPVLWLELRRRGRAPMWIGRSALAIVAGWTIGMSFLHSLPAGVDRVETRILARVGNALAATVEQITGLAPGPIIVEVVFPPEVAPGLHRAPLIVTGEDRDYIYVETEGDPTRVRLARFHRGAGGPVSDWIDVQPGRPYQMLVELGSFYPPDTHPHFREWHPKEVARLRRRLQVVLEGQTILQGFSDFYASDPSQVWLGRSVSADVTTSRFSGEVRLVRRLGLPDAPEAAPTESGPVRLRVRFPPFAAMVGQPLLSTGESGAGDLIYAFWLGPGLVRFGHDSWNAGAVESVPVAFNPEGEHTIEVDLGSLYPGAAGAASEPRPLRLRFNGLTLLDQDRHYHPSEAIEVYVGNNAIRASSAETLFKGPTLRSERMTDWIPEPEAPRGWGMILRRGDESSEEAEPLLATGRTGAADLLWMMPIDAEFVALGLDHWGRGGPRSDPVRWPKGELATLRIVMSSLPGHAGDRPDRREPRSGVLKVWLNDALVWEVDGPFHPATSTEIYPAANPVGATSAAARFSGDVIKQGPLVFE